MTKAELNKAQQQNKLESLEREYKERQEADYTVDRVTLGLEELTKIVKYKKRNLITINEYTNIRKAIEKFIF